MKIGANVKITTIVGAIYAGEVLSRCTEHVRLQGPLGKVIIPWDIVKKLEVL